MAEVAYLLGAGASAECLPVVNQMAKDMDLLQKEFVELFPSGLLRIKTNDTESNTKIKSVEKVLKNLKWICEYHYSVDTYAKKLFLTDKKAFRKLKADLCLYFTLRQIFKNPDKRYDNFFSSILTQKGKLPEKIKIYSWNYDFQIERSYQEYGGHKTLNRTRSSLNIISPNEHNKYYDHAGEFNIIKLNGSTRFRNFAQEEYFCQNISQKASAAHEAVSTYLASVNDLENDDYELQFAWEDSDYDNLFKAAERDLAKIEVLVIIGYSFPFFNRKIDMELINKMSGLRKIYIQDLNPENIKEQLDEFIPINRLLGNLRIEFEFKRSLDQFVFPKELEI